MADKFAKGVTVRFTCDVGEFGVIDPDATRPAFLYHDTTGFGMVPVRPVRDRGFVSGEWPIFGEAAWVAVVVECDNGKFHTMPIPADRLEVVE